MFVTVQPELTCYGIGQASHVNCLIPFPVLITYTVCTEECADLPELLPMFSIINIVLFQEIVPMLL